MTTERIHLFADGTQYMDWTCNNCDRCVKAGDGSVPGSSPCDLFEAIHDAAADDGTVTEEQARRLGRDAERYVWPCPEFQAGVPVAVQRQRDLEALRAWTNGEPIRGQRWTIG